MDLVAAFGIAVLIGTGIALLLGRGAPHDEPLPWEIIDLTRMQASLMATLGAVSITGIVLLAGLFARTGEEETVQISTAGLMFSIAFGFFVQTAYTLSYLPGRVMVGERLHRLYFAFGTTLQWRNVTLLGFALASFAEIFGLDLMADTLFYLVPLMIVAAAVTIAVVSDALGLVHFGEVFLALLVGMVLAALGFLILRQTGAGTGSALIAMSIAYAVVGGSTYALAALVPLTPRRPWLHGFLTRHARRLAMIDMQITAISMAFLWLAVFVPD